MGSFSIWHWLVVLVVVLILFGGGGKLSRLMGDLAKGVNAFKKGLKDPDSVEGGNEAKKAIDADAADASPTAAPAEAPKNDEAAKG